MTKSKRRSRRAARLTHRKARQGALPGTIQSADDAVPSVVREISYSARHFEERIVEDPGSLKPRSGDEGVMWIDVQGLGNAELIASLGDRFGLHPLAMEDVVNTHQRPKLEAYDSYLFLIVRTIVSNEHLASQQIAVFLTKNAVLTFREKPSDLFDPLLDRLRHANGRSRHRGADYLLYAILDLAIDGFFPLLERCGERLDQLEEEVSQSAREATLLEIHQLKGDLLTFRRAAWPLRDALAELLRQNESLIAQDTHVFFRDCYDHTIQIMDMIQACREMCADVRDLYLTQVNNRLSEVMKVLTIIATIFMPLSFLAGLYGMNFDSDASPWNMPELQWRFGYPFTLGLMAAVAGGMFLFFRRRGWLGR